MLGVLFFLAVVLQNGWKERVERWKKDVWRGRMPKDGTLRLGEVN
jgi:hypothetical protein